MDPDALVGLVAVSIPIVAIVGGIGSGMFKRWATLKEKQLEVAGKIADNQAAEHAAKIERLEAHVAVLNRIATDRATGLAHEIDSLRGPPAPLN